MTYGPSESEMYFTLRELSEIAPSDRERAALLGVSVAAIKKLRGRLRRGVIDEPLHRFALNRYWQRLMLAAVRDAGVHFNIPPSG